MTLGERIKEAREKVGISQRELGRQIEMTGQFIQKIEANKSIPTITTLSKISNALNIRVEHLITDNDISNGRSLRLVDLNLQGITPSDEYVKVQEENKEFEMAVYDCLCNPIEENKLHAIEEFWDKVQSSLSYLQITLGITANEVMEQYHLHLEKIKNRPR